MLRVLGLFILFILVWIIILGSILYFFPMLPPAVTFLAGMAYGGFAMCKSLDIGYNRRWIK